MINKWNTVLYTGVTNDLKLRVYEYENKIFKGFTEKYLVDKLVYYEAGESIENAILREKQIKGGPRRDKIQLVKAMNIGWHDLYDEL